MVYYVMYNLGGKHSEHMVQQILSNTHCGIKYYLTLQVKQYIWFNLGGIIF